MWYVCFLYVAKTVKSQPPERVENRYKRNAYVSIRKNGWGLVIGQIHFTGNVNENPLCFFPLCIFLSIRSRMFPSSILCTIHGLQWDDIALQELQTCYVQPGTLTVLCCFVRETDTCHEPSCLTYPTQSDLSVKCFISLVITSQ